jgi:hypothetical protein
LFLNLHFTDEDIEAQSLIHFPKVAELGCAKPGDLAPWMEMQGASLDGVCVRKVNTRDKCAGELMGKAQTPLP